MRKYFITGLVTLLPVTMTILVVLFIVNFLTGPFIGVVNEILGSLGLLENGFLFLNGDQSKRIVSQFIILIFLFGATVFLGFLTRWVFIHYFIRIGDYIFHNIPIIRSIYKTSKDVIHTIFQSDTKSFKQVVLVPFPKDGVKAIGLVTREHVPGEDGSKYTAVFVPTTPNPTSGFLMMFKEEQLTYLDMPVEEAFKYIISCGVVQTPFVEISQTEAREHMNQ